ncbi:MAG TPA: fumarylacetoacetate hydrolase family protein [Acidobacteriaceae bacterium]|nr:fumarylacetoacetate hydrolase family protein [Acidobacteriaceae bacterium]
MKLIRFGELHKERPGILTDRGIRKDLSAHFSDWDSSFWNNDGLARLNDLLRKTGDDLPSVPDRVRWGAPVARPGKIICIGLNYSDHAAETGAPIPKEPILFMKAANTVVGPFDDLEIPRGSTKTDWEVELGVIIGRSSKYLRDAAQAHECIAGYVLSHDVSEREFQLERGGQWTKGKSCDTFNPLGPFLLTAAALPDPQNLSMKLQVNGEQRQAGHTSTMIFDVFALVHYISQFMTLEPGDLISTGTPPGVGLGMKPPQYLKPGDLVELEIDQLGSQRQHCVAAP